MVYVKPRLLDLFCGPGGAGRGYQQAGFYVVGVDITPQPSYVGDEFHRADALEFSLDGFDAIHASPPCQDYSRSLRHLAEGYPRLIEPVRDRLEASGVPWVIENVTGAPLPTQSDLFGAHGVELCGTMFDLEVIRHRLFEVSFPIASPRGCDHSKPTYNPYNATSRAQRNGGHGRDRLFNAAMGIDWTIGRETTESIPPAYTEYIGRELLKSARLFALGPGGWLHTPQGVPTPIGPVRHACRAIPLFDIPSSGIWCYLGPSTRTLCADLLWRPVGDLSVGDELIAFEGSLTATASQRYRRRMRVATVTA